MNNILAKLLVSVSGISLLSHAVAGNFLFVAPYPSGVSGAPATREQPTNIWDGVSRAQPGDTVIALSGTYLLPVGQHVQMPRSGLESAPITLRADVSGAAVFDGGGTSPYPGNALDGANWQGLIHIAGKAWIVIDGIRLVRSGLFGVYIGPQSWNGPGSSNITVQNCSTFNTNMSGIFARDSDNISVLGNSVQRACQQPNIEISGTSQVVSTQECISLVKVDGFEIAHNTVFDRLTDPNNGGEGIDVKKGSKNGSIHHNLVYDLHRLGIYADAYGLPSSNFVISHNTVHNASIGITVGNEVNSGEIDGVLVSDNLVRDCQYRGIQIRSYDENGPVKNVDIYNNTVTRCGLSGAFAPNLDSGISISATNANNTGFRVRNNILSGNRSQLGAYGQSYLLVDSNVIHGPVDTPVPSTNTITLDPLFTVPADNDFRLASNSPAKDLSVGAPASTVDYLGETRSQYGASPDLGAFECAKTDNIYGLWAVYYNGTAWDANANPPKKSRREDVALSLGNRAPAPNVTPGNFSVRWTGAVQATTTGNHIFRIRTNNGVSTQNMPAVTSDNRVKLWIDDQVVIDGMSAASGNILVSQAVPMNAWQRHTVKMEFACSAGDAAAFLDWMPPGQEYFRIVPKKALSNAAWQETWRQANFQTRASAGDAADNADPDKDGLENLMEYALNLNPKTSQATALPVVATNASNQLTMTFLQGRWEVRYRVEASDDLKTWTPVGEENPGTVPNAVSVTDNSTSPNRYLRLRVTTGGATSTTTPEGRIAIALNHASGSGNQDVAASFPLMRVIDSNLTGKHCGPITAVGENSLTNSGGGWVSNQLLANPSSPYFVQITSGAAEGRLFLITGNSNTQLTVDTDGTPLNSLGIVPNQDGYEIIPAHTLNTLLPTGTMLSGASSTGDILKLSAGSTWISYYHDGAEWKQGSGASAGSTVVRPDQGWHITRRGPTKSLTLYGRVSRTSPVAKILRGNSSYVSLLPVANTLAEMTVQNLPDWSTNETYPTLKDHIKLWQNAENGVAGAWKVYYYDFSTAQWKEQATGRPNAGHIVLTRPSLPFMIVRPSGTGSNFLKHQKPY